MAKLVGDLRTCPTRIDRAPALFAHRVTSSQCADRQRGRYHKCYTCAYNHAQVKANGLPIEEHVEPQVETAARMPAGRVVEAGELRPAATGPRPAGADSSAVRVSAV